MSITRINEFQAAVGKKEALMEFMESLVPYITSSKGCISCKLLHDMEVDDKFVVIEEWESVEDHKNSLAAYPQEKMMEAMPLFASIPKGGYYKA